jgi:hypothetical protein
MLKTSAVFFGAKSYHFGQKNRLKIGKYAEGNSNFTEIY